MGDHVGRKRVAIAIPVQHDRRTVAFLDHIPGNDGSIGIFDHHPISEVVIYIVSIHTEIESIHTNDCILVFLELIGIHHNVMAAIDKESGLFVIGDDRVRHPRVFETIDQGNPMAGVMIDGKAVKIDLLNPLGRTNVSALLSATDAMITQMDPPKSSYLVFRAVRWLH